MYSIKPGRGPSLLGAVVGIGILAFGVFFTIMASSKGAPGFFIAFGILFVCVAAAMVVYHLYNATQKRRMSALDITTGTEEPDPIATALGHAEPEQTSTDKGAKPRRFEGDFCPYCGARVTDEFDYCPKCGKDI